MKPLTQKQKETIESRLERFEELGYYAEEVIFGIRDWLKENTADNVSQGTPENTK